MSDITTFNQDLLAFIQASPTPFHAVKEMQKRLIASGFEVLEESSEWQLEEGGKYIVTRNDSSIIAFVYGENLEDTGINIVGAHTDSPCLKVKPNPDIHKNGYWQLGVEVYGGVLLNPWFDRDLSLAGKVSVKSQGGDIRHRLIDFEAPVGMIPSLAIHLDREANNQRAINAQKDLPVILGISQNEKQSFKSLLLAQLGKQYPDEKFDHVLDYEMSFYDIQAGDVIGINQEFIVSARLDNLLSCYIGLKALQKADGSQSALLVCNDHEEVGSMSASGAQGPMLNTFLQRLMPEVDLYARVLSKSAMISADNAHGIHPNYADRHDANHGPMLNEGPVIKINANQRYASNTETQAVFRSLCEDLDVPVQSFVVRSDMACGSTIGPITAAEIGVKTVDIGVPTFGMHSIRETAGSEDSYNLFKVLRTFFNEPND